MKIIITCIFTVLVIESVHSCFTNRFWANSENKKSDTKHRDARNQTNITRGAGNPTGRDVEYVLSTVNVYKDIIERKGIPGTPYIKDMHTSTAKMFPPRTISKKKFSNSETNDGDNKYMKPSATTEKPLSGKRKKKKEKRASIHVIPEIHSKYPLPESFDERGNIKGKWVVDSKTNSKMELIIDSPKTDAYYNAAYIRVKRSGRYFIYGQVFFHGDNHEMAHCLHVADTYKPCFKNTCFDRKVMCSRSAPGHPVTADKVQNIDTNYIGGVVHLQKGSTIRLAIDVDLNINQRNSIELDKSLCYFGAFAL